MDSDWSHLPKRLLNLILKDVRSSIDYLHFSAVCASWYEAAKDNQGRHSQSLSHHHHHVPMLFFPPESPIFFPSESKNKKKWNTWRIYSILESKFLKTKIRLPPYGRCFSEYSSEKWIDCGVSSEGWMVSINGKFEVTLYKPFMVKDGKCSEIINLPPLFPPTKEKEEDHRYLGEYIQKVTTLTPDPIANSSDLICVVIFGGLGDLAYIRPAQDMTWTLVTGMERVLFRDVVYYNNQFYAVTYNGKVACFNFANPNLKLVADEVQKDNEETEFCHKKYLVECGGELLQIQRYINKSGTDFDTETTKFKVFKLSFNGWLEMKSLGDVALFLGDNSSISVLATNFAGCQKNCIYFTQDKNTLILGLDGPKDLGVYNLESGSVTRGFTIDDSIFPKLRKRAIWIVPPFLMC